MGKKGQALSIIIITGYSGAGKTQAVNCLEDIGYYCVDNLPPVLLPKFVEMALQSDGRLDKVALVIDVRGGSFFQDLSSSLHELRVNQIDYQIIFLEASEDVLVSRFKESRRPHPLGGEGHLLDSIRAERSLLEELRGQASVVIDTSNLPPRLLKEKLQGLYSENPDNDFTIHMVSFGFKRGIPMDSDMVMDVRFLSNPFYDPVMRYMTGEDQAVKDFVLQNPITRSFTRRFLNLLKFLIPNYMAEGKNNLAISIGCTGGQHRSVVLANYIGDQLRKEGYYVIIRHRDVSKSGVEE
ncbi:MAG: RNase adapter RapZ [Deltaproteobacteria bacterium]